MAKNQDGYLSAKESRRISKENRRITDQYEKRRKRRNVPESEYTTQMKDPANAVEFDNLHTYFFTDTGVVKSVDGGSSAMMIFGLQASAMAIMTRWRIPPDSSWGYIA